MVHHPRAQGPGTAGRAATGKVGNVVLPLALQTWRQKLRVVQSFSEATQPVRGRMPVHGELPPSEAEKPERGTQGWGGQAAGHLWLGARCRKASGMCMVMPGAGCQAVAGRTNNLAGPSGTPTPAPLSPQPSLGFHPGLGLMDPPWSPELVPCPHLELLHVFLSLIVNRFD